MARCNNSNRKAQRLYDVAQLQPLDFQEPDDLDQQIVNGKKI